MLGYGYGYYFDPTYILVIIGAILSIWASSRVNGTYAKYSRVRSMTGMTGAEAARRILDYNGLTSVRMPDNIPATPVVAKAFKDCGVILTAGQGDLKEKVLRLAHMGWIDWGDLAAGLHALAWSLPEKPSGAYLEAALDAYHKALGE